MENPVCCRTFRLPLPICVIFCNNLAAFYWISTAEASSDCALLSPINFALKLRNIYGQRQRLIAKHAPEKASTTKVLCALIKLHELCAVANGIKVETIG